MIIRFKLIVGLLALLLFVIFTFQNIASVTVRFMAWQFDASLSLILLISFLLGISASMLQSAVRQLRQKSSPQAGT